MVILGEYAGAAGAACPPRRGREFLAGGATLAHADVRAVHERVAPQRHRRHPVHLRHHRGAQGRAEQPSAERAGVSHLERGRGADARRPLPGGEPLLPQLRLQGRLARLPVAGRHALPPRRSSMPGRVLDHIERDRISVLPGPPTLYQGLLAHESLPRRDLASLRLAVTGAASVPPVLITRMRTELKFRSVLTAYGLTESTGVVTVCPHDADDETVATRCGVRDSRCRSALRRCRLPRRAARHARGGAGARLQRDARLLRGSAGDRARRSMRTAGCTPATWASSMNAVTCASPTG